MPAEAEVKGSYRHYMVGLLLVIMASNNVDRLALGLVLQDIKLDLKLSDTQLGLLTGLAFALFYSVMGIPIARWADRGNRVTIISATIAIWSSAVALCGAAGSFVQLLLIRIGVAVGEAGCIPPAHSLIADYFDRGERARAVSLYMLGGPLSMLFGYFLAGWLNQYLGWRWMFVALGVPGLFLALVAWFTLREPRLHANAQAAAVPQEKPPTTVATLKILWRIASYRNLAIAFAVIYFFGYGIMQWQPAFFIRSFGLKTGELGMWFTLIYGVCGLIGTYWGGELASRFASGDEALQLRTIALLYVAFTLVSSLVYFSPNLYVALLLCGVSSIGGAAANGPLFAVIQTLVPGRMRATSLALMYLFANLVGMGLGPLAAGAISDGLRPLLGEESLRYALLCLSPGYLWGAWHVWRASRTVAMELPAEALTQRPPVPATGKAEAA